MHWPRKSIDDRACWAADIALAASLLVPTLVAAQQAPPSEPLPPSSSVKKSVNLVEVPALVRDEKGRPVLNLKAGDFRVYDDGKLQTISRFRFVSPSLKPSGHQASPLPDAPIDDHVELKVVATERRSVLIVIPQLQFTSRYYALRALEKAFRKHALDDASVAIVDTASLYLPFTSDRDSILQAIERLKTVKVSPCHSGPWVPIATERVLQMRSMLGRKFLLFFTDFEIDPACVNREIGIPINSPGSLIWEALASNVAIYPVDPRGPVPVIPVGDASASQYFGPLESGSSLEGRFDSLTGRMSAYGGEKAYLTEVAAQTGGRSLSDYNDLGRIFTMMEEDSSYYELGYYLPDLQADGRYHRIRIELANGGAHAWTKQGYFAPIPLADLSRGQKRDWLYRALLSDEPLEQISLNARSSVFFDPPKPDVSIHIGLAAQWWVSAAATKEDRRWTMLVGLVQDVHGTVVDHFESTNFWHEEKTAKEESGYVLQDANYNVLVHLKPGRYSVKLAVADMFANIAGSRTFLFAVADRPPAKLFASSLVLSDRLVEAKPVGPTGDVGADEKKNDNPQSSINRFSGDAPHDPLAVQGRVVIPSVNRVFRNDAQLTVFLRFYTRPEDGFPDGWKIVASLRDKSGKVIATSPTSVVGPLAADSGFAVESTLDLSKFKLSPGSYQAVLQFVHVDEKNPFQFNGQFWIAADSSMVQQ